MQLGLIKAATCLQNADMGFKNRRNYAIQDTFHDLQMSPIDILKVVITTFTSVHSRQTFCRQRTVCLINDIPEATIWLDYSAFAAS